MCSCGKGGGVQATYTVTYPDGSTATKASPGAARIAAAKVAGATWTKTPATASS